MRDRDLQHEPDEVVFDIAAGEERIIGQILLDHRMSVTPTKLDNRPAFVDVVFLIRVK